MGNYYVLYYHYVYCSSKIIYLYTYKYSTYISMCIYYFLTQVHFNNGSFQFYILTLIMKKWMFFFRSCFNDIVQVIFFRRHERNYFNKVQLKYLNYNSNFMSLKNNSKCARCYNVYWFLRKCQNHIKKHVLRETIFTLTIFTVKLWNLSINIFYYFLNRGNIMHLKFWRKHKLKDV